MIGGSGTENLSIASVCPNGATLAGGSFSLTNDVKDRYLNAGTTGLSAALSSATSNQTYLDLAQKSADFVRRHLYRGSGVFLNQIKSKDCSPVGSNVFPYDTGSIVLGLSILASLTRDTSTMAFVREIVVESTSNSSWHQPGQILNLERVRFSDHDEPKVHLMRGYTALYRANTTSTDLKSYLGSYISTQFNSVVDLSASPGSNVYGPEYDGPVGVRFDNSSQAGAIAALLGGLAVGRNNASQTPSGSPSVDSDSRSRSTPVGVIVGAVIGGIALVGLVIASVWTYNRRCRTKAQDHEIVTPWKAPTSLNKGWQDGHRPSLPGFVVDDRNTRQTPGDRVSNTSPITGATTEELVLALNQRLRNEGRWDLNEAPPEYHSPLVERSERRHIS
ncbi:hypothetical protein PM082_018726 [Marasmius tenuissimus]|nr:hypothetical protein PM082_018726 [Marasmius tenuissimus]